MYDSIKPTLRRAVVWAGWRHIAIRRRGPRERGRAGDILQYVAADLGGAAGWGHIAICRCGPRWYGRGGDILQYVAAESGGGTGWRHIVAADLGGIGRGGDILQYVAAESSGGTGWRHIAICRRGPRWWGGLETYCNMSLQRAVVGRTGDKPPRAVWRGHPCRLAWTPVPTGGAVCPRPPEDASGPESARGLGQTSPPRSTRRHPR